MHKMIFHQSSHVKPTTQTFPNYPVSYQYHILPPFISSRSSICSSLSCFLILLQHISFNGHLAIICADNALDPTSLELFHYQGAIISRPFGNAWYNCAAVPSSYAIPSLPDGWLHAADEGLGGKELWACPVIDATSKVYCNGSRRDRGKIPNPWIRNLPCLLDCCICNRLVTCFQGGGMAAS
jgi:hypothetical protein